MQQGDIMKTAVRDNRRGMVRVAHELLVEDGPELAMLRSRMDIFEEFPDLTACYVRYIGYAPEFDPVELGSEPPEYDAIFTAPPPPGREITMQFSRRGSPGSR